MRTVYLNLYRGARCPFNLGMHTSVYVEGDAYEWTYARSSDPACTHGVTFHGVVHERPMQFLYGDWTFWKTVAVGTASRGLDEGVDDGVDNGVNIREAVKSLAGAETFADGGYQAWNTNCWAFCKGVVKAVDTELNPGHIKAYNDECHSWPKGTTRMVLACLS